MKRTDLRRALLIGVAAVAVGVQSASAFAAGPVAPASMSSGYLELYGQGMWTHDHYDPWSGFGGAGRLNYWTAPDRSMQFDLSAQTISDSPQSVSITTLYGAFHLSHRNSGGLWGGFVGLGMTSDALYNTVLNPSVFGGVEAQRQAGPVTLYGQVGFVHQTSGNSGPASSFGFGQIEARYFVMPDFKLSANLGVFSGNAYGSGSHETWVTYGAEAEYKLAANPFSLFARADGFSGSGFFSRSGFSLQGGVKVTLGGGSLQDQNLRGATLKVANDLVPVSLMRVQP